MKFLLSTAMLLCAIALAVTQDKPSSSSQPDSRKPSSTVPRGEAYENVEVLSDTQGVDFGPYMAEAVKRVRMNWYNLIPEEAKSPLLKQGNVSIEFVIMPDGRVVGMVIKEPSGDANLDRAAWGGIKACNPFEPLPRAFQGPYLALRFHFLYNPPQQAQPAQWKGQPDVQVRLSEILIRIPDPHNQTQVAEAQRKASDIREAVRRGSSFAEMAKANSQGPTAAIGGDLGCFSHGQLSEPLEQLVFSMTVGEVSNVVRTEKGFVILQATGRGEPPCASQRSLRYVKPEIAGDKSAFHK